MKKKMAECNEGREDLRDTLQRKKNWGREGALSPKKRVDRAVGHFASERVDLYAEV